ncbi:uncharacterized protein [Mytilus edulis]|uniref:uncharacterized protein n=1 Tax=Mytilus edulis TaxID=6550 RepID=UPI0039EE2970
MNSITFYHFCVVFTQVLCYQPVEKRLLLTDPDVIMNELTRLQLRISQQDAKIAVLENTVDSGSTYTIWGRKACPSTATTLYSGYAAGGNSGHAGSAAESLCLPPDPEFNRTKITAGASHAIIYGAEYYSRNFFSPNGEDVPCSVCHSKSSAVLMIPGRNSCYHGWKPEYYGYLASGHYADAGASSYICIDINPENLNGGEKDVGGRNFFPVIVQCQPLQCPPYHQNYPLTCVVCSK